MLGLSRGLTYEAIRQGEIPSIRIGRRIIIPRASLEAMLQITAIADPESDARASSDSEECRNKHVGMAHRARGRKD